MKPGDAPLRNLAAALLEATGGGVSSQEGNQGSDQEIDALTKQLRQFGAEAVTMRLTPVLFDSSSNLLLLIDQFEEIFRFGVESNEAEKREEAEDFIALMLALAEQKQLPIYVVLTMRSDFLGDCDNFYGLPEVMNRSQYLVPRPTRLQRQQAIEGPIRLFGAQITPRLLDRVLNDVGDKSDQLPVMQHALMRTWERWQLEHNRNGDPDIDLPHYEAIGGITNALSRHADEAFDELPDDHHRKVAEKIFKALTGKDKDNPEFRRPVVLGELYAITQASEKEVKTVIETFRKPGRSFLMPPIETKLSQTTQIDVSHESLIRNWKGKTEVKTDKRLNEWVEDESKSAQKYIDLVKFAERSFPLKGKNLQEMLDWQKQSAPNLAWARRYKKDEEAFRKALGYLAKFEAREKWRRWLPILFLNIERFNRRIVFRYIRLWALWGIVLFIELVRDPSRMPVRQPTQSEADWAATVINASVYWLLVDVYYGLIKLFDLWNGISNPIIKLGVLFVGV